MENIRARQMNACQPGASGPVVYWMSRDQRVRDNWALLYAQKEALRQKVPLVVLFCFVPDFFEGTIRQYGFMLRGLQRVEQILMRKNIPFFFSVGEPKNEIPKFLKRLQASAIFTDFSPLRTKKRWQRGVAKGIHIPFFEVDTHNIIPCWKMFSSQVDHSNTFRLRMRSLLPTFLDSFPVLRRHPIDFHGRVKKIRWEKLIAHMPVDRSVSEVSWIVPGEDEAWTVFRMFLRYKVREYRSRKDWSDMRGEWQWRLTPYLHFGQLSVQRMVWSVMHSEIDPRFKAYFLDTLIVRRELSDHFCYHNPRYDSFRGFPEWARKTLDRHRSDPREHLYSRRELEGAKTHDPLWNTIQRELVSSGRIFGWARKYWSKKLLEWTRSPEDALRIAIAFTEKYGLSGWNPSAYANIAWAIGGLYDDPSDVERPVIGRIRYLPEDDSEVVADVKVYCGKA